jgi:uncharacterized membrane protein YgaE (UPF0421/DUF939 family)
MGKNKTGKYFKYAIGEIVLVVVGILIALTINNKNENRKLKNFKKDIYKQIRTDLVNDSLNFKTKIDRLTEFEMVANGIIDNNVPKITYDTINNSNYRESNYTKSIITLRHSVSTNDKGYKLLNGFNDNKIIGDSLDMRIQNYYNLIKRMNETSQIADDLSYKNLMEYKKFDWYLDWLNKKYNPEMIIYLKESKDYKIRLAQWRVYAIYNYKMIMEHLQSAIPYLLELIDENLKK